MLGIWTQVFVLGWQALYPLSPNPKAQWNSLVIIFWENQVRQQGTPLFSSPVLWAPSGDPYWTAPTGNWRSRELRMQSMQVRLPGSRKTGKIEGARSAQPHQIWVLWGAGAVKRGGAPVVSAWRVSTQAKDVAALSKSSGHEKGTQEEWLHELNRFQVL